MKNPLNLIFILILFQSCSKKEEVLVSFGNAKIGMSVNDFFKEIIIPKKDIDSSLIHEKTFKYKFSSLKVSENITLKNTTVEFKNGLLENIEVENNPKLFELLVKKFKVEKNLEKTTFSNSILIANKQNAS